MSSTSLENLNELVYVDISSTSSETCPINSKNTPCIICQEKCSLSFTKAYFQASCNTFAGGLVYSNVTTSSHSYLTFNENTFNVTALYVLTPSINTYSVTEAYCDFVIEATSTYGYLIIYIPISIGSSTSIPIPDDLASQSLANINFYNYLPSQMPFYFFNSPYKSSNANYVIFPPSSCNVTITSNDYIALWNLSKYASVNPIKNPPNDYFTQAGSMMYYNKNGANLSDSNDYYLDCQMTDSEEIEAKPKDSKEQKKTKSQSETQGLSTAFVFVIIVILCVLLYLGVIHMSKFIA